MTARKKLAASSVLRAGLKANRCVARETGFYEIKKGTSYTRSVVAEHYEMDFCVFKRKKPIIDYTPSNVVSYSGIY